MKKRPSDARATSDFTFQPPSSSLHREALQRARNSPSDSHSMETRQSPDKLLAKTIAPRRCSRDGRALEKEERERERTGSDGTEESRPVRLTECHNSDSAGSVKNVCTRDRERNNCAGPSLGSLRNYRRGIYPATGGTDRCYQFIRGSQPMAARLMTF